MCLSRDRAWHRRWWRARREMLRKGPGIADVVAADGPAIRRRRTRHAIEDVVLVDPSAGCGDGGGGNPLTGPGPVLDGFVGYVAGVGVVVSDRPAVRRRRARVTIV